MLRKAIVGIILICTLGALIGVLIYNKPHKDLSRATPDVVISAEEIFAAFEVDEQSANKKFLGKIIEVRGEVRDLSEENGIITDLILESEDMLMGVNCEMDPSADDHEIKIQENDQVTLVCICSGYTMDVVMNRCIIKSK